MAQETSEGENRIEIIADRLYFATLEPQKKPRSTTNVHYFNTDEEFSYARFFEDFGPLCLSAVYRYQILINDKLKAKSLQKRHIIHYCRSHSRDEEQKRLNAAFLMASYMIIQLQMSPREVIDLLVLRSSAPYIFFRDASFGPCSYQLTLQDCICGLYKAMIFRFFNIETFNVEDYEYYEKVENGDLNWIVNDKFLAFCGPHPKSKVERGVVCHGPESYIDYFKTHGISTVVRLNRKMYDSRKFTDAGVDHHDLYFLDGGVPTDDILQRFISICETAKGAIAVHCKAGLGRTGTLIGCYLMKHYRLSASEAIAWLRIARPGSVIGPQQYFMERKQNWLWSEGEALRSAQQTEFSDKNTDGKQLDIGVIMTCVNDLNLVDNSGDVWTRGTAADRRSSNKTILGEPDGVVLTQGDCLNLIKLRRRVKVVSESSSVGYSALIPGHNNRSPRSLATKRSRSAHQKTVSILTPSKPTTCRSDSARPARAGGSSQNLPVSSKSSISMPVRVTRSSFRF